MEVDLVELKLLMSVAIAATQAVCFPGTAVAVSQLVDHPSVPFVSVAIRLKFWLSVDQKNVTLLTAQSGSVAFAVNVMILLWLSGGDCTWTTGTTDVRLML